MSALQTLNKSAPQSAAERRLSRKFTATNWLLNVSIPPPPPTPPTPKYPVIEEPKSSSESQETKTKNNLKNEINGCACQRPMCHQTPQAYKEPFEQMDSNSCRRGLVPNVPGADVCLPRVPQSESDPTLSRLHSVTQRCLWPLFSCSSTLHFQSFDPNCLFCLVWQKGLESWILIFRGGGLLLLSGYIAFSAGSCCLSVETPVSSSHRSSQLLRGLLIQTNCSGNNTLNI